MSSVTAASSQSAYRGYEYYKAKNVQKVEQIGEVEVIGSVFGSSNNTYDVRINPAHPRKSQCTCPHAAGKQVVCKHMVAVYFTAFPMEA